MLEVGSLLDGKYKILNEIGHGGMSVVYLALNERANKTWAVKEVRKDGGNDTTVVSQGLVAETEMLKKLNHPNLPSIIDVIDKDDSFIIVMDYIEGNSLQDLLDASGPQPPDKVIEWSKQLCDVLGYLHSRRPPIIYRDMKPANVMLRPNGDVTLIDFGTAREYKDSRNEDTTWLGTRGYAAPEQFGGRGQTDARTDVYNLGATMYHLVTGYSPADTNFVVHPIGNFLPHLKGSGLEKIINKCCQPDPRDRYQNCAELLYALEHVHDEDYLIVRQRNRRWNTFVAFAAIAFLSLIGGIIFRRLYNSSLGNMYDSYISDAEDKGLLIDKIKDYGAAIERDPEREEAWTKMIRDIQNREEERLSTDEVDAIRTIVKSGAGSESNLERLGKSKRKAFAKFNYDLGIILFFSSDNGRKGASGYLEEAVNHKDQLDEAEAKIAEMMYDLAQADADKTVGKRDWGGGDGYRKYWTMLAGLLNGTKTTLDELENDSKAGIGYPLAVCNEVSNALLQDLSNFKSQGVTQNDMNNALNRVQNYLEGKFGKFSANPADPDSILELSVDYQALDESMKSRVQTTVRDYLDARNKVAEGFDNTGSGGQVSPEKPTEQEEPSQQPSSDNSGQGSAFISPVRSVTHNVSEGFFQCIRSAFISQRQSVSLINRKEEIA